MLHIAASESLEQFGMTNLFPPFIPSHQPLPKPATNLTEAAARAEADTRGIGQPAARPSPRQDVSLSGGTMPHVPTAAVHTGLVSKGYRAPNLGGVCAVTADSSSPQSVAQLEATVSVNPGAERAPLYALSADSSHQHRVSQHRVSQHSVSRHGMHSMG
ncbi:TPA: hypothetical protein ACH3X1_006713 [Trebouxia sp. C0004]